MILMEIFRNTALAIAIVSLLAACSKETSQPSPETLEVEQVQKMVFHLPPIPLVEDDLDTRASFSRDGDGFFLLFEKTDTLGICPAIGSPIYFTTTDSGGSSAAFDGGAWKLRMDVAYYSYFPFIPSFYLDKTCIPIGFDGQVQQGIAYPLTKTPAFFACEGQTEGGVVTFNYKLANCYININATLPAGTYTRMHLRLDEPLFVRTGTVDITQDPPAITPGTMTDLLSLELKDVTLATEGLLAAYVACAPIDLREHVLSIYFLNDEGFVFKATKSPKNAYVAGNRFGYTCAPTLDDGYSFGIAGWTKDEVYEGVAE